MNVHIANDSRMSVGGSWTFMDNLKKYAEFNITSEDDCDVALISGVTTVTKDTFRRLKNKGKKIVIRHDGVPEPWRNPRIDIGARLRNWSKEADAVVYQSHFNKDTVGKMIGVEGSVIFNGVDEEIFNEKGKSRDKIKKILYVYWREDPNKRPEEIIVRFRELAAYDKNVKLIWAGKAPQYLKDFNFGFLYDEKVEFVQGALSPTQMADLMKKCDYIWFPSFADTAPNTLLEALHCGCEPEHINNHSGTAEYVKLFRQGVRFTAEDMAYNYKKLFEEVLNKD